MSLEVIYSRQKLSFSTFQMLPRSGLNHSGSNTGDNAGGGPSHRLLIFEAISFKIVMAI